MTSTEYSDPAALIGAGGAHLGLELGSTRIKAALIDDAGAVLGTGSHAWENRFEDESWTYSLDSVWTGIQDCYADLVRDVQERHGADLTQLASLGISAMMHGYLPFDADGAQLAPFRTWRNTYTTEAAGELSRALELNIPLRWSVAHLLHAIRGGEEHVERLGFLTTLAGYVHWQLTGHKVLGVGDASGMFPIAGTGDGFDAAQLERFSALDGVADLPWSARGPPRGAGGRPGRRITHRRGRGAAGPQRRPAVRRRDRSAGGRRRHRDGGHPRDRSPHRQRLRRHQRLRDGGPRGAAVGPARGDRHGHHPRR
ncbi:FGGY family carbohydrate kinase [Brachybacterium sp. Z12]|uniref:FGGY family carbohydrate kinase n=1 Tax=Brachybacterium sp. Z12 TaxID=2759167 RepID=UPI0037BE3AB1